MAASKRAVSMALATVAVGFVLLTAPGADCKSAQDIDIPSEAVSRKVLDNGLAIFASRSPTKGIVAIDVKVLAGSSLEGEYLGSGISHVTEHMIFKGTRRRPAGSIEREVKSYGGIINGSASQDFTSYYLLIPTDKFDQGLELLRDMLGSPVFDNAEFEKEREVVLKEINLSEDEPDSRLMRRLYETAYIRHPYKHPVIGYRERLKKLTRDDLIKYFTRSYAPNRMSISIVGDLDSSEAVSKVEKAFGDLGRTDYTPVGPLDNESVQLTKRILEEESRANLAYLAVGFHSTGVLDRDLYALDVLSMILGRGDNSRLYSRLLKEMRLVYSISAWNSTPRDPGLFTITAITGKDNIDKAESAISEEIANIRDRGVTAAELSQAKRMALADYISTLETVDGRANDIGASFMLTGDPAFSRSYVDGIKQVTMDDLARVTRKYLGDNGKTVVKLIPGGPRIRDAGVSSMETEGSIIKTELPNGIRVLLRRDPKTPTVSIVAVMLGGIMAESAQDNGISNLTSRMLLGGTRSRPEDMITGYIESLGGSVSSFSGLNSFGVGIDILKPDLEPALDIVSDILANSEFPQKVLEREKGLAIAVIMQEDDDIFDRAFNALRRALFAGTPYELRYAGTAGSVEALTREKLQSFYKRFAVSENIVLSISGDIDPDNTITAIRSKFSGLPRGSVSIKPPSAVKRDSFEETKIKMDKEESLLVLGFEATSITDHDRYAIEVLGSVLSGQSGRLFDDLRSRKALAYTLGSVQKLGLGTGFMALYLATTEDLVEDGKRSIVDILRTVREKVVSDEELASAKRELIMARKVARQSNSFSALNTAIGELYGLGYKELYDYDGEIEKVTATDLRAVARKYLDPTRSAEVIISPE